MSILETDNEPDFINEEGVKWWVDKGLTEYANSGETPLKMGIWIVETTDGHMTRLAVDEKQNILKDTMSIEAMACWIDAEKFLRVKE